MSESSLRASSPADGGNPDAPPRWAWGVLWVVIGLWGTHYAVLKLGTNVMPAPLLSAWRISLTALVLWPLAVRWGGPRPTGRRAMELLGLGLLGSGLYQGLLMEGIAHTSALTSGLVSAAGPAVAIGVAVVARRVTATKRMAVGLALAMFATALMSLPSATELPGAGAATSLYGVATLTASLVAWGVWSIAIVHLAPHVHPLWLTAYPLLVGVPVLWAVAGVTHPALVLTWPPSSVWAPLLWSGLIATPLTRLGWTMAIQQLGVGRATVWTHLETPIAVLTAVIWLGDRLQPIHGLSALVLGGALWLLEHHEAPGPTPAVVSPTESEELSSESHTP